MLKKIVTLLLCGFAEATQLLQPAPSLFVNSVDMSTLSQRGAKSAALQHVPWRFAPGGNNRYDKDKNPTGVVAFATAENNLVQDELVKYVNDNITFQATDFLYRGSTNGGAKFPKAMASHINAFFKPFSPVQASDLITTSGLTPMHHLTALSIGDPGDGILVGRPIYGRFELDFGNVAGLKIVYADMDGVDPFGENGDVIERYEIAFEKALKSGIKVKAVMIVNPNNPTGRCYTKDALVGLMKFAQKHKIHLISDEVYALSTFDNKTSRYSSFTSVLSINRTNLISDDLLHVFYGMSKDFGAAGLKLGCIVTQDAALKDAISSNTRFSGPSGMSAAIATKILEDKAFVSSFITLSRERIRDAYVYTTKFLDEIGVQYWKGGNAGFFIYIDLSPYLSGNSSVSMSASDNPEFDLAQKLLDAGVGLHPREEHWEKPAFFRLVFTQERHVLQEGLNRLKSALQSTK
ncbi:putative aspartate aminotransferase [Microthyrium microscopicum]|uniref:Putative aspartate aminotransferase n=1 Tax=Microthyrium microscopicum TaxID=703497 RepID=A0A6A6U779_9PEZI|nr:putative aspartate aminotransferase [Microthyrium microscopicum]